jgi:hypothetical protein
MDHGAIDNLSSVKVWRDRNSCGYFHVKGCRLGRIKISNVDKMGKWQGNRHN